MDWLPILDAARTRILTPATIDALGRPTEQQLSLRNSAVVAAPPVQHFDRSRGITQRIPFSFLHIQWLVRAIIYLTDLLCYALSSSRIREIQLDSSCQAPIAIG